MSRWPNTRFAFARLFANLAIVCIPNNERGCLDVGFSFADLLLHRAAQIKVETK